MSKNIHGFKLIRELEINEIQATLYEFIHEKTNAKTIWLKRADENKTFSIAFKTTPVDDTGVFHILEHSVLNGSKRYPVKEPFVDLLKGSLQTFLNAMTFPDKTVYPVSSRNNQDYINLMRVYLDAVFYPLAIQNPNRFYQEGWHYELNDINEIPSYKGVVFNEMKGAFSSADSIRSRLIMHSLFPDNCYGNESGGDPNYITDLTYEQFVAAHNKYYSPSNSYIFLDGDIDIDNILQIINDEYLNNFEKNEEEIIIAKQKPIIAEKVIKDYEVAPDSELTKKAQIAKAYVIGNFDDYEKISAFSLITSILCNNNESPLKKAILENDLGEDIYFAVQDGILQPFVEIDVINTDLQKEDEINEILTKTFKEIIKQGINKEELEAYLNQAEFKAKEREFGGAPKGLVFNLSALDSWLYGGKPEDGLCFDDLYASLRTKINTSYYEDLIEEYILNSNHCATVLLKPSNTLGQEKIEKENAKLAAYNETLSEKDKQELIKMNEELSKWQNSVDTPEQKATLPYLRLSDLNDKVSKYPIDVDKYENNIILKHPQDTNGITYVSLYINTNDLELPDYTILGQMTLLFGKLKTKKYDVTTLNRMIKAILGDFNVSFSNSVSKDRELKNMMVVTYSCLQRNNYEATELVKEIIYNTDLSDFDSIKDILKQNIFGLEQTFIAAGHAIAVTRAGAYSSASATIAGYHVGYEAYKYLKNIDDNYDELGLSFCKQLSQLRDKILVKERYTLSIAPQGSETIIEQILKDAPSGTVNKVSDIHPLGHAREGMIIPSNVSYAAKVLALPEDIEKIGTMYVISNILSLDYLWNEIRVKGGAYGCGQRTSLSNNIIFHSYRDPNPDNSLQVFTNTVNYLKKFVDNNENIENYIVGTTGEFDPLFSTKQAIKASDAEYLINYSYELKQSIYNQILNTTIKDIEKAITYFEKVNEADNVCVVGNKQAIEQCKDKLDTIFDLIK